MILPVKPMHPSVHIGSAQPEDAKTLAVLATQVWLHTYAIDGVTSDIAEYVLSELSPEKFLVVLNDPSRHVLVAAHARSLVGLAVVKFGVPCPNSDRSAVELKTLYVQEHFIGCGVGKSLLQTAEAKARAHANTALWLTVNAKNTRAIAFYVHQGYTKVGTTYFVLGEGRHENHVFIGRDANSVHQGLKP
jgi:ribosomal protein S18 acetylase RimI-like enzyme